MEVSRGVVYVVGVVAAEAVALPAQVHRLADDHRSQQVPTPVEVPGVVLELVGVWAGLLPHAQANFAVDRVGVFIQHLCAVGMAAIKRDIDNLTSGDKVQVPKTNDAALGRETKRRLAPQRRGPKQKADTGERQGTLSFGA